MQLTGSVKTVVERHGVEEYTRDSAGVKSECPYGKSQPAKEQVSDAPADLSPPLKHIFNLPRIP